MTSLHHFLLGYRISDGIKKSDENLHLQWGTSFYTLRKKTTNKPKVMEVWFFLFQDDTFPVVVYSPSFLSRFYSVKRTLPWIVVCMSAIVSSVRFQMPKFIRNHCIYQPQQGSIERKFKMSIDLSIKFDSFEIPNILPEIRIFPGFPTIHGKIFPAKFLGVPFHAPWLRTTNQSSHLFQPTSTHLGPLLACSSFEHPPGMFFFFNRMSNSKKIICCWKHCIRVLICMSMYMYILYYIIYIHTCCFLSYDSMTQTMRIFFSVKSLKS